jgi:hypothetical protein
MPLFLIALGVVGIENALTRYFAVAKWSEYGYWIISIVMAGFALSGVVIGPVPRHGGEARASSLRSHPACRHGAGRRLRLPGDDGQSVQSAAAAEPDHLAGSDAGISASITRPCCPSSSSPASISR